MQSEVVDLAYVLSVIRAVLELKEKENLEEIKQEIKDKERRSKRLLRKLGGVAPDFIVNNLSLSSVPSGQDGDLADFRYNKMVCLNFLAYCLENAGNLRFDLAFFENEADRKLLLEHLWNNIYIALSSGYPQKTKTSLEYRRKYAALRRRIQKRSGAYVLEAENRAYTLPIHHFEEVVFFHKYGVDALPGAVKENLAGKDFIDAGAYIGDTALIFNELQPKRIYAFEPSAANHVFIEKTVKLNKLTNVEPVRAALGNRECVSNLFLWENASFLTNGEGEGVPVTTIDSFREKNGLDVGLIKMDIEGSELYAIQGAEETIKASKPVLIISVYHSGRDFFEIPPLLKRWMPTYNFRFLSLNQAVPILERVLLAY
ncbi:MAG: FkbM family methyltransferase [Candidatus Bathyarchaeota archaeon]|nr:FkbM family methyltransferase [Candidatus Bathyarchaeota archaeon]